MNKVILPRKIQRVLIRGVNWIGDTIITLPTIQSIKALFPYAHMEILLKPRLAPLFKHCTFVDALHFYPEGTGCELLKKERMLVEALRSKRFDLAVILPRSVRSALIPFLARIPFRIGYSNAQRMLFLTHKLSETKEVVNCHQVDYYYAIARALGADDRAEMPVLTPGDDEETWAQSFLDHEGIDSSHYLIAINPGSTYGSAKCWHPEKYRELSRRLARHHQVHIILIGGEDNVSLIDAIAYPLNGHASKVVGTDLLNLAALLKRCDMLISNDTGPMHIAAAVGTPVFALFGSTNVATTAPLGPDNHIIRKEIHCSPCLKRTCPENHLCMELITVDEVERAVMETVRTVFRSGSSRPSKATEHEGSR